MPERLTSEQRRVARSRRTREREAEHKLALDLDAEYAKIEGLVSGLERDVGKLEAAVGIGPSTGEDHAVPMEFWEEEAKRYAANADYWRRRYDDIPPGMASRRPRRSIIGFLLVTAVLFVVWGGIALIAGGSYPIALAFASTAAVAGFVASAILGMRR